MSREPGRQRGLTGSLVLREPGDQQVLWDASRHPRQRLVPSYSDKEGFQGSGGRPVDILKPLRNM